MLNILDDFHGCKCALTSRNGHGGHDGGEAVTPRKIENCLCLQLHSSKTGDEMDEMNEIEQHERKTRRRRITAPPRGVASATLATKRHLAIFAREF